MVKKKKLAPLEVKETAPELDIPEEALQEEIPEIVEEETAPTELVETEEAPSLVEEEVSGLRADCKYTVVTNLKASGTRYAPGDSVYLNPKEAKQLLADGVVK